MEVGKTIRKYQGHHANSEPYGVRKEISNETITSIFHDAAIRIFTQNHNDDRQIDSRTRTSSATSVELAAHLDEATAVFTARLPIS